MGVQRKSLVEAQSEKQDAIRDFRAHVGKRHQFRRRLFIRQMAETFQICGPTPLPESLRRAAEAPAAELQASQAQVLGPRFSKSLQVRPDLQIQRGPPPERAANLFQRHRDAGDARYNRADKRQEAFHRILPQHPESLMCVEERGQPGVAPAQVLKDRGKVHIKAQEALHLSAGGLAPRVPDCQEIRRSKRQADGIAAERTGPALRPQTLPPEDLSAGKRAVQIQRARSNGDAKGVTRTGQRRLVGSGNILSLRDCRPMGRRTMNGRGIELDAFTGDQ